MEMEMNKFMKTDAHKWLNWFSTLNSHGCDSTCKNEIHIYDKRDFRKVTQVQCRKCVYQCPLEFRVVQAQTERAEDRFDIRFNDHWIFFGVYDGHSSSFSPSKPRREYSSHAVETCQMKLGLKILTALEDNPQHNVAQVIHSSILSFDEELVKVVRNSTGGASCSAVLLSRSWDLCFSIQIGDSSIHIIEAEKCIFRSAEHVTIDTKEYKMAKERGAKFVYCKSQEYDSIVGANRALLNKTRCLGSSNFKQHNGEYSPNKGPVICTPSIYQHDLREVSKIWLCTNGAFAITEQEPEENMSDFWQRRDEMFTEYLAKPKMFTERLCEPKMNACMLLHLSSQLSKKDTTILEIPIKLFSLSRSSICSSLCEADNTTLCHFRPIYKLFDPKVEGALYASSSDTREAKEQFTDEGHQKLQAQDRNTTNPLTRLKERLGATGYDWTMCVICTLFPLLLTAMFNSTVAFYIACPVTFLLALF